jgi:hypothetical protein
MAEIINLRQRRKQKSRDEREKVAAANRAYFGQSKDEKQRTAAKQALAARKLEGHKVEKE